MKTISVRLPEQYLHDIEEACKLELVDKGTMLRKLVGTGLREYRTKKALELYREGKISLWKAAGMAGISNITAIITIASIVFSLVSWLND